LADPAELAHPNAVEDAADRRARQVKQIGEFGRSEPQAAQRGEQLHGLHARAVGDVVRR
jgi:hypothetical protein